MHLYLQYFLDSSNSIFRDAHGGHRGRPIAVIDVALEYLRRELEIARKHVPLTGMFVPWLFGAR